MYQYRLNDAVAVSNGSSLITRRFGQVGRIVEVRKPLIEGEKTRLFVQFGLESSVTEVGREDIYLTEPLPAAVNVFTHYPDITPNYNDVHWRWNLPRDGQHVWYTADYTARLQPVRLGDMDEAERIVELRVQMCLVARIEGDSFKAYYAEAYKRGEPSESQLYFSINLTRWVAQHGQKVYDTQQAAALFPYLAKDYGLKAVT